jgi:competence protein ComEA
MFEKLSKKIGLTSTEIKVGIFIISTLLVGFSYKHFILDLNKNKFKIIDEKNSAKVLGDENLTELNQNSTKSIDKKVDYKQEVLDFNKQSFNKIQKKTILAEKSINLNTAKLSDLVKLSGIGEKIAQRIIDYRNNVKKFDNINELLKVKGIGSAKFEKIKKYIFVD